RPEYIFDFEDLIEILERFPHGVFKEFSGEFSGVESSSNLAKIGIDNDQVVIVESLRGASKSALDELKLHIENYLKGFKYYYCCEYPGWQTNKNSRLLELAKNVYFEMFQENPKVEVIHAGLECGILYDKNNSLDIISVGPNIRNPHSPDEKVYLSSIEKSYRFVYNIIRSIIQIPCR
ncbi:MAG: M20/M25/M40 family metallo-hydrolase, partial [Calditerrivibrio sp.]|nr:M20/M25/M40 family metallo-hydrolase [Calditerrivibrio sp.]